MNIQSDGKGGRAVLARALILFMGVHMEMNIEMKNIKVFMFHKTICIQIRTDLQQSRQVKLQLSKSNSYL